MVMTGTHAFTVTLKTCTYAQSTIFLVILELIRNTHKFHVTVAKPYEKWTTIEVLRDLLHLEFDTFSNLDKLDIGKIPLL